MNKIQELEKQLKEEKSKELYANFLSPGTFVSETDRIKINKIDLPKLCEKAKKIEQRHGAKPYGFRIEDGNGKALSGTYYITGKILLYVDIPDNDKFDILKSNMKNNGYPIVIENRNSYRFTSWFEEDDFIVDWNGKVIRRGNDADLLLYRATTKKAWDEEWNIKYEIH